MAGTIGLFFLGTNFYPYFFPHYIAAVTSLFLLMSVRGLENLAGFRFNRQGPMAGQYLLILCAAPFLFWFALYGGASESLMPLTAYQSWNFINYGDPEGRIAVQHQLANSPGKQLVIVRYSPLHAFHEWIHNAAEIDAAQIVWANDLGDQANQKLLQYYPDREAWLLEPDVHPPALEPYPNPSPGFLTVH